MKKLCLSFVLCAAMLLSACSGAAARGRVESFSEALCAAEALSFQARVRAEYDDKTAEFTLEYASDEGGCYVTVLSPEMIKGVRAHISDGSTALEYEGVRLDTGALDDFGLTPMSALAIMVDALRDGYLDSVWEEGDVLSALFIPSDELGVELRLDKYTLTPIGAEISSGGRVRVFAEIENWAATMPPQDAQE